MDGYDQLQACLNGHVITDNARSRPQHRKAFCTSCGAPTIDACEHCRAPIPGEYHVSGVVVVGGMRSHAPKYCGQCGRPFPWQQAAIENAIAVLEESGLAEADVRAIEAALPDVVLETPKTQSASMRVKRLAGKMGKPVYDVAIGVITEIASETAKKTFGLK